MGMTDIKLASVEMPKEGSVHQGCEEWVDGQGPEPGERGFS